MIGYFEYLIKQWYVSNPSTECEYMVITQKELMYECRKIYDKVAIRIAYNSFESKAVTDAVLSLPRLERIIIIFNIVGEFALVDIAQLLGTNLNSIYVQKHSALKRLRNKIGYKEIKQNEMAGGYMQ